MTISKTNKAAEYERYAAHCLEMVRLTADHDRRVIHREMAAEWLRLADEAAIQDVAVSSGMAKRSNGQTEAES